MQARRPLGGGDACRGGFGFPWEAASRACRARRDELLAQALVRSAISPRRTGGRLGRSALPAISMSAAEEQVLRGECGPGLLVSINCRQPWKPACQATFARACVPCSRRGERLDVPMRQVGPAEIEVDGGSVSATRWLVSPAQPGAPSLLDHARRAPVPAPAAALHIGDQMDGAREIDRHHVRGEERVEAGPRSRRRRRARRGARSGLARADQGLHRRRPEPRDSSEPAARQRERARPVRCRIRCGEFDAQCASSRPTPRCSAAAAAVLRRLVQAAVVGGSTPLGVAAFALDHPVLAGHGAPPGA